MSESVTVLVTSAAGETTGALALPAEVFDAQANIPLMHQVVVAQLAAARQGTHSTKTRGDVSGGGAKPYRQKGTGRARQGSTRAPQFTGGGVSHGPVPHGYAQRTPKKMKAAALRGALSDRARGGNVHVLSAVVDGDVPSTKSASAALAAISTARNVLVVIAREDEAGWRSLRNLKNVHLLPSDQLNTYDVLVSDDVVFTRAALDEFLAFSKVEAAAEVDVPADKVAKANAGKANAGKAKAAKAEKPAKADKSESTDKPAKAEKPAKADKAESKAAAVETAEETAGDEATEADSVTAEDTTAPRDFGPGSHAALEDDSQPEGYPIKGNADSMLYHVPGSSHYDRTVAEVWFDTAESAEAAGFALPPSQRKAAEEAAAEAEATEADADSAADAATTDEEDSK